MMKVGKPWLGVALAALATTGIGVAAAPSASAATAATAAPTLTCGSNSSHVATKLTTTVDANSNIRSGPYTSCRIYGTTKVLTKIDIVCYAVGERVQQNGYNINIWYRGNIGNEGGEGWNQMFVWGGNVNTHSDPAPGVPKC